ACDEFLMIDRRVEKAAILFISEAVKDLIDERARGIEISTMCESFVRQRESPGSAGVILQQTIDVSVADDAAALDPREQEVGVAAHRLLISSERQLCFCECGEAPAIPTRQDLLVARRPTSLRADSVQLALPVGGDVGQ